MSMKWLSVLVSVLSAVELLGATKVEVQGGRIVDYGDVIQGEIIHHSYLLRNTGDEKERIIAVNKSCNCTEVRLDRMTLEPGDSTQVSLDIDTIGKIGPSMVNVILSTGEQSEDIVLMLSLNCLLPDRKYVLHNKGEARRMALRASRLFRTRYSRNYGANIRYTYTVSANEKYCEIFGYEGAALSLGFTQRSSRAGRIDDPNENLWYPQNGINSFAWNTERTDTIPARIVVASGKESMRDKLKWSYDDRPNMRNVFDLKRTVEVCSPLNKKKIKFFDLWISSTTSEGTMLGFRTKRFFFPLFTRLSCSGEMFLSPEGYVTKIIIYDARDYWAVNPYRRKRGGTQSFTKHVLEIGYLERRERLYTDYIALSVLWRPVSETVGADYYITPNRRKKPSENRLEEHQRLVYYNQFDINGSVDPQLINLGRLGFATMYAPYEEERWSNSSVPWLDWEKIERDLTIRGMSLWDQAKKRTRLYYLTSEEDNEELREQLIQSTAKVLSLKESPL